MRHQFLVALQIGLGDRYLRHTLPNFSPLQGIVQLNQHLPFTHFGAVAKAQDLDPARHLGAQHDTLAGAQRTDGLRVVLEQHLFNPPDFYASRPRR